MLIFEATFLETLTVIMLLLVGKHVVNSHILLLISNIEIRDVFLTN